MIVIGSRLSKNVSFCASETAEVRVTSTTEFFGLTTLTVSSSRGHYSAKTANGSKQKQEKGKE